MLRLKSVHTALKLLMHHTLRHLLTPQKCCCEAQRNMLSSIDTCRVHIIQGDYTAIHPSGFAQKFAEFHVVDFAIAIAVSLLDQAFDVSSAAKRLVEFVSSDEAIGVLVEVSKGQLLQMVGPDDVLPCRWAALRILDVIIIVPSHLVHVEVASRVEHSLPHILPRPGGTAAAVALERASLAAVLARTFELRVDRFLSSTQTEVVEAGTLAEVPRALPEEASQESSHFQKSNPTKQR